MVWRRRSAAPTIHRVSVCVQSQSEEHILCHWPIKIYISMMGKRKDKLKKKKKVVVVKCQAEDQPGAIIQHGVRVAISERGLRKAFLRWKYLSWNQNYEKGGCDELYKLSSLWVLLFILITFSYKRGREKLPEAIIPVEAERKHPKTRNTAPLSLQLFFFLPQTPMQSHNVFIISSDHRSKGKSWGFCGCNCFWAIFGGNKYC